MRAHYIYMKLYLRYTITLLLAIFSIVSYAQGLGNHGTIRKNGESASSTSSASQSTQRNVGSNSNQSDNSDKKGNQEEDPCNPPVDDRFCWTVDPITGITYAAVPDTSYIGLCNHDVMESKAMSIVYTSNLYGPHQINQYFSRKEDNDFIFANAYSLFAYNPSDRLYFNTKIPYTIASYSHSGATLQANDHLFLDFAGNIKPNIGLGTTLDYVYARGEYTGSSTKPIKWNSYLYYQGEQYKAYATFNLGKYANQEYGGITDRDYVLHPDIYNDNFTTPRTMPTKLSDTWNDTDVRNVHFVHTYDLGKWEERREEEDSTQVWDEFIPVATIFHSFDFDYYKHSFIMGNGADQTEDGFFANNYYSTQSTNDSTSYNSFSTYVGLRLNEGFNKYSQFGISAFIGYERQNYTMLTDTLNVDFIANKYNTNTVWLGGQISRHLTSTLTFDVTGKTAIAGDEKLGDIDINGRIQTVIPFGKKDPETGLRRDSVTLQVNGFFKNTAPSVLMNHYFSNHFRWNNDFDKYQRVRIEGLANYTRSNTTVRAGVEHIRKYIYFSSEDFLPRQNDKQLDVLSFEVRQGLKFGIFNWNNAILFQKSSDNEVLSLPSISIESDFSMRFRIAKTLSAQLGVTGYYNKKYYASTYQPATQQFATQNEIECGGFPTVNGYLNCNLKRIKFFVMMTNLLNGAVTTDTFIMPDYPMMPRRFVWGVSLDLQN